MPRTVLTEITLKALKPPSQGQVTHWDKGLANFGVRVSAGGAKTFVLLTDRRGRRVTIGRFPTISLAQARAEAKRQLAEKMLGREELPVISFEDAKNLFVLDSLKRNRERTAHDYARLLKHFGKFATRAMSSIRPHDVSEKLDELRRTPAEAAHALVAIKVFFNWACRRGYLISNPCSRMRKQSLTPRSRVLSDAELKAIFGAAAATGYPFGHIVLLLVFTGQRRNEVGRLEWRFIDREARTITLPPELTKNGRQHTCPFGSALGELIDDLPTDDGYLFAGRDRERPFNGWSKCKARLDALSGVSSWTLHDLRRTFATNLAKLSIPPHVVEKLLNHASGTISGVAAIYNQFQYMDEMCAAVAAWDAKLATLMTT